MSTTFKSYLKYVFLINLVSISFACQVKKFENANSFVCVCDDKYCDTLDSGPFSFPGSLTIYTSDSNANRLSKTVIPESALDEHDDSGDIHVTVNVSQKYQSINGFGGAFTDASGYNMNKLSATLKDRLLADYFGIDGAQYNLARVPIAGTDFSTRCYSYDDVNNDFELKNFALAQEDFDYKIPNIKKAFALNDELKLFASPWAPPAWLKTNNDSKGLGILIGEPGSLHWKTWANYFVKFFDSYKEQGIEFWGVTPQNEPLTGLMPGYRFNTLGFSPAMMRDFIKKDLGPTLKNAGYGLDKVKIMIYDHNTDEIFSFARDVLSDSETASYVSGVAYHWYDGLFTQNLDEVHDKYPNVFLLSTEACNGFSISPDSGVSFGNWTRGEFYAIDIIGGLNHWSTGWVDWNMALDPNGSPSWVNNVADAPIIISLDGSEYYKQPTFYTLAHFSKFLKRGSVRVDHTIDESKVEGVHLVTFVTPSNELVVIALNVNEKSVKMTFKGVKETKFTLELDGKSLKTIIRQM